MVEKTQATLSACVIGDPVAHSLSPRLHGMWIKALNLNARYTHLLVKPEALSQSVEHAFANPAFVGMNITLPHKQAILKLAGHASKAARQAGAANLLVRRDGALYADNTDIEGFCAPLLAARAARYWRGQKIVIIGAGGAARAALIGSLKLNPGRVELINRTDARARALGEPFGDRVSVLPWSERKAALGDAALLVNASAAGMKGFDALDLTLETLAPNALVYDLIYTPLKTPLLAAAEQAGFSTLSGLDMLIAQARPSFEAFFGAPAPKTPDVRQVLECALKEEP